MDAAAVSCAILDVIARELALFACVGFLIGGIDDLFVDLVFFARRRWRPLPAIAPCRRLAVFVPAWDEAAVIGAMLTQALGRFDHPDYRLYVGCYPNDPATVRTVLAVAGRDARVRLVINPRPGPTTKGDNLNALWRALLRDEAEENTGWRADAVVLHDAEDVVHPAALRLFDQLLAHHDLIQLPVLPLIDRRSRWVSAHYADEFAESHVRTLAVRQAVGAALPLAGVGCALGRTALERVADRRGGLPFDADSLVEDYEVGMEIAAVGGRGCFACYHDADGRPIATRALFPRTLGAARRQKGRWLAGIALLGWDRLGWGSRARVGEYWMRMRDRRGPVAVLVLAAAYASALVAALAAGLHLARGTAPAPTDPLIAALLLANSAFVVWRMANRGVTTARAYGWREGVRAIPRTVVGNAVALLAMRQALGVYARALRGRTPRWDKTAHSFPGEPA